MTQTHQAEALAPALFKHAMRRFAASVTIIATGRPEKRSGLTATAVCSLTAEPAQVIACLNASSSSCTAIREAGCFSVNVLHHAHQTLAQRFAGANNVSGERRFDVGDWIDAEPGVPILADASIAMVCKLRYAWPVDTHILLIGAVERVRVADEDNPLIYRNGQFGTWALA
jgi:flavin reductase (DIM6/NTAB) family NADH-FMN oxidoreductase RutF